MRPKRGKILKVIPGINPNCSSGMFAMAYMVLSIPVYLVINIVANVISYKAEKKQRNEEEHTDIFAVRRSIKRLLCFTALAAIVWLFVLVITLNAEKGYGNIYTRIMAGVMISYPPIALIISLLIAGVVVRRGMPKAVFVISPLSYLIIILILWLCSGVFYSLISRIA